MCKPQYTVEFNLYIYFYEQPIIVCSSFFFNRPLSQGGKRSVFLVNTVALAHQQREAVEKATNLKTAIYTGTKTFHF